MAVGAAAAALAAAVPVIAFDPVDGGANVADQARPVLLPAELSGDRLDALAACLDDPPLVAAARALIRSVASARAEFLGALRRD